MQILGKDRAKAAALALHRERPLLALLSRLCFASLLALCRFWARTGLRRLRLPSLITLVFLLLHCCTQILGNDWDKVLRLLCRMEGRPSLPTPVLYILPCHVQILGKDRDKVAALGRQLGLDGSYIPHSFIEQVCLRGATCRFEYEYGDIHHPQTHSK